MDVLIELLVTLTVCASYRKILFFDDSLAVFY